VKNQDDNIFDFDEVFGDFWFSDEFMKSVIDIEEWRTRGNNSKERKVSIF